jgi:hypothetical protein
MLLWGMKIKINVGEPGSQIMFPLGWGAQRCVDFLFNRGLVSSRRWIGSGVYRFSNNWVWRIK